MEVETSELVAGHLVTKDSIFAIRAESVNTSYFLLICDLEEKEHTNPEMPFVDDGGHSILYGTKYIVRRYLEVKDFNDRFYKFSIARK